MCFFHAEYGSGSATKVAGQKLPFIKRKAFLYGTAEERGNAMVSYRVLMGCAGKVCYERCTDGSALLCI